jgi:hypothetical protein
MAPRDDRATRGRLRGVVSILLTATIGLAGCGDQAASAPTANPANCSQDVSACNPGDIGAGGGTVFLVVGDGAQRIIVEYAQAGWSGTGEDPQLDWRAAASASSGSSDVDSQVWRLPSQGELTELYAFWKRSGNGEFSSALYWSATPWGDGSAWYRNFEDGSEYHSFREATNFVRPVLSYSALGATQP